MLIACFCIAMCWLFYELVLPGNRLRRASETNGVGTPGVLYVNCDAPGIRFTPWYIDTEDDGGIEENRNSVLPL